MNSIKFGGFPYLDDCACIKTFYNNSEIKDNGTPSVNYDLFVLHFSLVLRSSLEARSPV